MSRAVLVTGGARRIGAAICRRLAAEGWNVAVHFRRSADEAEALVAELRSHGIQAKGFSAELNSADEITALFAAVIGEFGTLQAVVNNAAHFEFDRGDAPDWNLWDLHMNVNLRAAVQLAGLLHAQASDDNRCCVVNLLDQKVFNLNPDFFSYTIAKIALEGATRMLALEFAPQTRVCALAPGLTLQSGDQSAENFAFAHTVNPMRQSSTSGDLAGAVSYLLNAGAVTGSTLIVDGGQHLLPLRRDIMFEVDKP